MPFPTDLEPSSRSFDPGDYPVKQYRSQNGTEIRILYGDKRTNMKLQLEYVNITDANAERFLTHYDEVNGTFGTFSIGSGTKTGWSGSSTAIDATAADNVYRYDSAPQVQQVRSGISTVTVNLIGVL